MGMIYVPLLSDTITTTKAGRVLIIADVLVRYGPLESASFGIGVNGTPAPSNVAHATSNPSFTEQLEGVVVTQHMATVPAAGTYTYTLLGRNDIGGPKATSAHMSLIFIPD